MLSRHVLSLCPTFVNVNHCTSHWNLTTLNKWWLLLNSPLINQDRLHGTVIHSIVMMSGYVSPDLARSSRMQRSHCERSFLEKAASDGGRVLAETADDPVGSRCQSLWRRPHAVAAETSIPAWYVVASSSGSRPSRTFRYHQCYHKWCPCLQITVPSSCAPKVSSLA